MGYHDVVAGFSTASGGGGLLGAYQSASGPSQNVIATTTALGPVQINEGSGFNAPFVVFQDFAGDPIIQVYGVGGVFSDSMVFNQSGAIFLDDVGAQVIGMSYSSTGSALMEIGPASGLLLIFNDGVTPAIGSAAGSDLGIAVNADGNDGNARLIATNGEFVAAGVTDGDSYVKCLSTGAFQIRDAAGNSQFAFGPNGTKTCTLSGGVYVDQLFGVAHVATITAGAGAGGAGLSIAVTGNNLAGVITMTAGAAPSANATVFTLNFATTLNQAPGAVVLVPANAVTQVLAGAGIWPDSVSTAGFVAKVGAAALVGAAVYKWWYWVAG
jgi:hypothetical protein